MTSQAVLTHLSQLETRPTADKPRLYNDLLEQITSPSSSPNQQSANIIAFVDAILSSSIGIISARPILTTLIQSLNSAPSEVKVQAGSHISAALQPQITSYEEQDATVREILASGYEAEEDYSSAAKALQGIHLDTTQRQVSDLVKVQTWIRIVRYYLEDDDTVSAETALNKMKNSQAALQVLQNSPDMQLHYQLSQARILDSRRDFLSASAEYLSVSLSSAVAEADRLQALSAAIKTAVLAPAGPQRSKTLGRLYKDERSLETEEYGILEKMFLDRLLSQSEVDAFADRLLPHQLAQTADGSTVLSRAVVEHNLLAASKLYDNISTAALAQILGLKDSKDETAAEKAEDYAAKMVEQARLKAEIDQIAGVITFQPFEDVVLKGGAREMRMWDHGIQGLMEDVEKLAAFIREDFPASTAEQMVH